jgi:membrane associated rhomboid family serine protease
VIPIPIRDDNPTSRFPVVTVALIVVNALVWIGQLVYGVPLSTFDFGAIPAFVVGQTRNGVLSLPDVGRIRLHQEVPFPLSMLTYMFLHGGWLHVIGNLWFLWIFGDNVEDALGGVRFFFFYIACGLAAALAQVFASPLSTLPMVGASGAIAGVLGAYIVLYPHARVRCLWVLVIFIMTIYVPAWLLLGLWFMSQFFIPRGSGVAWVAHVGGFLAGIGLLLLLHRPRRPPPRRTFTWVDERHPFWS